MKAVLLSTYELGRQPFGLASPAAWLRRAGAEVTCADLSRQPLPGDAVRAADLIAFYIPMHTATRLAARTVPLIRQLNPGAHLCFFGLYAPMNENYLRSLGAQTILGGEFEEGLVHLVERLRSNQPAQVEPTISLTRLQFLLPNRSGLPPLNRYARLQVNGNERVVGYTEASRGCKHLCRHCPIVPVYNGVFRIVQPDVVLADIRQQVSAGAEHITFGDPDFFNGPGHALEIVEALHNEFPQLTYDVTIKVEHLLKHSQHLPALRATGCVFVTSAVESVDDAVLARLDKGHTRDDFFEVVRRFREAGLVLAPTFVPFTPWTTLEGYLELLNVIAELELIDNVAPIQLAIRLLIPAGSKLLELLEVATLVGEFDPAALVYPWKHTDPRVDSLQQQVQEAVHRAEHRGETRSRIFDTIWTLTHTAAGRPAHPVSAPRLARAAVPYLNEPWYC
ncbi:MAG TPA: CUAEP/CCAEP-tail radical SAM protein [Candidatus Acidoferrales bacterium]|nr:CUAEP/CCAEP-tail radical SAM protein [Candidatus Acidoferrales bacterium]